MMIGSAAAARFLAGVFLFVAGASAQARWERDLDPSSRRGAAVAFDAARGETLLFGGFDGADRDETWVWNGAVWQLRQPAVRPSARTGATMAWDSIRQRIVLFGGQSGVNDLWAWDGINWTQLQASAPAIPAAVTRFLMHDPVRDRLVLLSLTGSSLELSEFDGSAWQNVTPFAPWPPFAFFAAAAFDPGTSRATYVPLTGSSPQLWRWNGVAWTSHAVSGLTVQYAAQLVHDPIGQRLLLVGGVNDTPELALFRLNAAGTSWQPLASGGPRSAQIGACFDTVRNRLVLVGGESIGSPVDSSVFEWGGGPWLRRTNAPPGVRHSMAVAHDSATDRLWLFGGMSPWGFLGDMWQRDALGWQLAYRQNYSAPASVNPGAVPGRQLVYDEVRQQLLLLGGDGATFVFWRWTGAAWQPIGGAMPPARIAPGVVFDRRRGRVVLFGGQSNQFSAMSDTWAYDGATWTQLLPATVPPARFAPGIAYDPLRDRIVMSRGVFNGPLDETWEFDGSDWRSIVHGASFPGLVTPSLAYDLARQVVVAVAPGSTGGVLRSWQWTGAVWNEVFPADAPLSRPLSTLLPSNDGVLSFGGATSFAPQVYPSDRSWLRTPAPAAVTTFGASGVSAGGPLTIDVPGYGPWLGGRVTVAFTGVPPIALPGLWVGSSRTEWSGLPLPIALDGLGWPQAVVRVAPEIGVPVLNVGGGTATASIDLPVAPAFVGLELHLQSFVFEPLSGALTSSNALTFLLGLR